MGRAIALDIARGLTFLHSNNIAHMDLKTPNGAALFRALPCHAGQCGSGTASNQRAARQQ